MQRNVTLGSESIRQLISMREVLEMVPYSRSSIYRLQDKGAFPKAVKIGEGRTGFYKDEIVRWINSRPRANRN